MKKILFLFGLLLAVSAQAQEPAKAQQVKYTVKGVSKENGKTVYLEDMLTSKAKVVDSTVVAKGKFVFKGVAEKDAIFAITLDKDNWQSWHTLFFNDGKTISVNMNDSTLKGSPLNERLAYYNKEIMGLPSSYYPEYRYKMTKKMFEEERGTLLPAALIVEGQRAFGGKGLLSMLEEKPVYAEHPKVKQYAEGLKRMATATVVTSGRTDKVKADEKAAKDAFIGQQFTDFEMADTLGNTHKLSEYVGKGHWVLVDFWASWCGPCLREMPNVVAAYEKYHTKGLDIVGVSLDGNRNPWVKAITKQNMPWVHLSDLKAWESLVTKIYKINAIPDNLLIDPQGKVVARELFGEALHEKLKEIFKEE